MICNRRTFIVGAACAIAVTAVPILPALGVLSTVSTIDGVLLAKGDCILVSGAQANNGVWTVTEVQGGVITVERVYND